MFRIFFLVILFFSDIFALDEGRCGTMHFANIHKNKTKKILAKEGCSQNYETALERRTDNFIIYYVNNKNSQHTIKTTAYIDSLALYLENAYKLHKGSLGMNAISGVSRTLHYNKRVPDGLYPVEVLDLGLLMNNEGEYSTAFGITFELSGEPKKTQIAIENDFLYGADCNGNPSTKPFTSTKNGDYSKNWHLALKATVFHELYHAFQFMYSSPDNDNSSFWYEASATGVEAIGAPEVKDYIGYLSNAFKNPGKSMEDSDGYGYATLYLFLYKNLDPKFDSEIWKNFSKNPRGKFSSQLATLIGSEDSADSLFHEYARNVFFSGSIASEPQASIWWPEQNEWPTWSIRNKAPSALPATAIDFAKVSSDTVPQIDSVYSSLLEYGQSSVWVFSRLFGHPLPPPLSPPDTPPEKPIVFSAFPNPWNPNKNPVLKFNLSKPYGDVEIRSANGALLDKVKGKGNVAEWRPKNDIPPGILYYRMLPYGKNKALIVKY